MGTDQPSPLANFSRDVVANVVANLIANLLTAGFLYLIAVAAGYLDARWWLIVVVGLFTALTAVPVYWPGTLHAIGLSERQTRSLRDNMITTGFVLVYGLLILFIYLDR